MDNQTQPNTSNIESTPKNTPPAKSTINISKILPFVVLGILVIAGSVFASAQVCKDKIVTTRPIILPSPTVTLSPTKTTTPSPTVSLKEGWKTTKFGGLFSYEYPSGWHVAELWQENIPENGELIAIDPNPINTSPRGGPLATFMIYVLNGNKNPDEILANKMANFNETNYTDITKETISADIGTIYHYKGKIAGEMLRGEPVESYFFTFDRNSSDPLNQQVIVATLDLKDDPQLSEMLKHIVLSFKKLHP